MNLYVKHSSLLENVHTVKFGISPSPFRWWTRIDQFIEWIQTVEDSGYDGIFIPDHYSLPVPPFLSNELLDAWTTLSYITCKTNRVKLGTVVSPLPRWVPSQLAKIIATVDVLSNGRTIAGFGAGYYENEFVNYAPNGVFDPSGVRFEKFIEAVQVTLKLWSETPVHFNGKYYRLVNAVLEPKPAQKPHPPIWSGGQRTRMIEVTAKYFDGWVPHRFKVDARAQVTPGLETPAKYAAQVAKIKRLLKELNRDENKFTFASLGEIGFDSKLIEDFRNAGCEYYIVEIAPPASPRQYMELTKKFAKEIIASFT